MAEPTVTNYKWVMRMSADKIEELQIHHGDTMSPRVKRKSDSKDILLTIDEAITNGKIRINCLPRNDRCVRQVDIVSVQVNPNVKYRKKKNLLLIDGILEGLTESLFDKILKPHFLEENQPVCQNFFWHIYGGIHALKFKVFVTDFLSYSIVAPDVVINCDGESINPEDEENAFSKVVYYFFF